jgi:hypothetical protein
MASKLLDQDERIAIKDELVFSFQLENRNIPEWVGRLMVLDRHSVVRRLPVELDVMGSISISKYIVVRAIGQLAWVWGW